MAPTTNKPSTHLVKRWILLIGIFLLIQGLFVGLDNTPWQPNINDSGSLLPRIMRDVLDSALFQEWIAPYSLPSLNVFTVVHMTVLVVQAVRDIVTFRMGPNPE